MRDTNSADVESKVIAIVAQELRLRPESLNTQSDLMRLGCDSIMFLEIIAQLEETFDSAIEFNANTDLRGDKTIARLVQFVEKSIHDR
jgi:acyl carrier protein